MTKWKIDWGAVAVLALLGVLMMGPLLAPQDPELVDLAKRLQGPSAANLLGTDNLGRDIWSRVLTGAQVTVGLSLLSLSLSILIGVPLA